MKLIGLSGTNGSGKDTVAHFLSDNYNYLFISGSDMLREECRKRGLPVTRENLSAISTEWRREGGPGFFLNKIVAEYEPVKERYAGLVVSSIRHPGEVGRIHELGGKLVWVDADPHVRYARVQASNRGRDGEDQKTYEEFFAEEEREMHPLNGDPQALNMAAVRDLADIKLLNETTLEDLQAAVVAALHLTD